MVKKTFFAVICFIGLIIFVSTLHAQGSKKTITLPGGEVVCDLNGEWDVLVENYGGWATYGSYPQIWKITQTGSSFVAVRMINDKWNSKGSEAVRGELDKSGFKNVQINTGYGLRDAKGQISDDGNKMEIDAPDRAKLKATRK